MNKPFLVILCLLVGLAACQSASDEINQRAETARKESGESNSDAPDGALLFRKNCVTCHGADGKLGLSGAKDLSQSDLPLESRIPIVTNGKGLMTPFKALLKPEEIQAVAAYSVTLRQK